MRKIIIIILVIVLYIICNPLLAKAYKNHLHSGEEGWGLMVQDSKDKSKGRELTIYMRVKDHLTHDDIDSTMTARLLMAADSSYVDSVQISRSNYQGQRFYVSP